MNLKGKNILVVGGYGMIGRQLILLLLEKNCSNITIVGRRPKNEIKDIFTQCRYFDKLTLDKYPKQFKKLCKNDFQIVFNLTGKKGSPYTVKNYPVDFFSSVIKVNSNLLDLIYEKVEWYVFTSTIGVYPPAEIFNEKDVWKGFPSEKDWFGGWAKRMGELELEAYKQQFGFDRYSIIRPSNVYGPYDCFDNKLSSTVISSLIFKCFNRKHNAINVWGDGTPIRDFIYAKDVARGMIFAVENEIKGALNMGSGIPITIDELVKTIIKNIDSNIEIIYDKSKPNGDAKRLMNMEKAFSLGYLLETSLEEGIEKSIKWYKEFTKIKGEV